MTTSQRIQRAQRLLGREDVLKWIVAALLVFTLGIGPYVYMQSELNKGWQSDEMEVVQTSVGAPALRQPYQSQR